MKCPNCDSSRHRNFEFEKGKVVCIDCNRVYPFEYSVHESGAVRSADADDVRYDLISPIALEAWAKTCAEGAAKYGDFNWEKGLAANDILNHAIGHIFLFLSGDRTEDHLGHALWNVGGAIHSLALWPELNEGKLRQEGCKPPKDNGAKQ